MHQDFYAETRQHLIGPVWMLPQAGSTSGGSKRPLNSYAIVREDRSILFDAPVSWAMADIRRLALEGDPPAAMVISHRDIANSGDAFDTFHEAFDVPIFMHPDDQQQGAPSRLSVPLADPLDADQARVLAEAEIEVVHVPGHSPGSIMLYLADEGGIVLAGDCAVGPGPEQSNQSPRLQRPIGADEDPRFLESWHELVDRRPIAAVLPLHGLGYTRAGSGRDFDAIVEQIWAGEPMDPSRV